MGKVNPIPRRITSNPKTSTILVDCDRGLAAPGFEDGYDLLVKRARSYGIAILTLKNACHFHTLRHEVESLASVGLIGLSAVTTKAFVAPPGSGANMIYGTNPMSFGWPRGNNTPPLIFDQASSAMARGEIAMAAEEGRTLPPGAAVDRNGEPTVDPTEALDGAQLPFGGHKGASIALMIELLASAAGSPFSFEQRETDIDPTSTTPTASGQIVVAISPEGLRSTEDTESSFLARNENLFRMITESGPDARLPGSSRIAIRKRSENEGVEIPNNLYEECVALGAV